MSLGRDERVCVEKETQRPPTPDPSSVKTSPF